MRNSLRRLVYASCHGYCSASRSVVGTELRLLPGRPACEWLEPHAQAKLLPCGAGEGRRGRATRRGELPDKDESRGK